MTVCVFNTLKVLNTHAVIKYPFRGSANFRYSLTYIKVEMLVFKYVFKNNVKNVYLLLI